ncbi:MAG: hypothetical protein FWH03_00680 [Firmicutes bacterium]|nr:hypothetical protein [Bacillota bacterium]
MKILAIGKRNSGKTCYFNYARSLFKTKGKYASRTSPMSDFFSLPKDAEEMDFVVATGAIKSHDFTLRYERGQVGGDKSVLDFSFVDVPGGIYDQFLQSSTPPSDWESILYKANTRYGYAEYDHRNYNAILIIVDGEDFKGLCIAGTGSQVQNLIECSAQASRSKGRIPTYLVIAHADKLSQQDKNLIDQTIKRIVQFCISKGLPSIDTFFVDVEEPKTVSYSLRLNSHSLDNDNRRRGQIPFLKLMKLNIDKILADTPRSGWFKKIWVVPKDERLEKAIKAIDGILNRLY